MTQRFSAPKGPPVAARPSLKVYPSYCRNASHIVQHAPSIDNSCTLCGKTVYVVERQILDGKCFHKACLKCAECGKVVSLGSYAIHLNKLYCKQHYTLLTK